MYRRSTCHRLEAARAQTRWTQYIDSMQNRLAVAVTQSRFLAGSVPQRAGAGAAQCQSPRHRHPVQRIARLGSSGSTRDEMGSGAAPTGAPSGVDVDSVMRQLGVLGRFHRRVYPLVALAAMQVGLLHTTYIFLAADVNYRYNIYGHIG